MEFRNLYSLSEAGPEPGTVWSSGLGWFWQISNGLMAQWNGLGPEAHPVKGSENLVVGEAAPVNFWAAQGANPPDENSATTVRIIKP